MTVGKFKRPRLYLVLALPLVVACSGGSEAGAPETPPNVVGTAPAKALGSPNVVMLVPEDSTTFPTPPDTLLMDQYGLDFFPKILIVRVGQTVEFRNSEVTDHNVEVSLLDNDSTLFSVGSTRGFPNHFTFDRAGGYAVSCNIHSGMRATIVVVSTPWAVPVEEDGTFALWDVPEGSYRLVLWSRDPALRSERPLVVGTDQPVTVDLR